MSKIGADMTTLLSLFQIMNDIRVEQKSWGAIHKFMERRHLKKFLLKFSTKTSVSQLALAHLTHLLFRQSKKKIFLMKVVTAMGLN
jgi:hypothetical protein